MCETRWGLRRGRIKLLKKMLSPIVNASGNLENAVYNETSTTPLKSYIK